MAVNKPIPLAIAKTVRFFSWLETSEITARQVAQEIECRAFTAQQAADRAMQRGQLSGHVDGLAVTKMMSDLDFRRETLEELCHDGQAADGACLTAANVDRAGRVGIDQGVRGPIAHLAQIFGQCQAYQLGGRLSLD